MRIVLGNASLATYLEGGGHWSWFLQYPLGLRALHHDVFWLELVASSGEREHDLRLIRDFFQRLASYGLDEQSRSALQWEPRRPGPRRERGVWQKWRWARGDHSWR